jgi:hypothetical protein
LGRRGSAERETSIEADMDPHAGKRRQTKKAPGVIREPLAFVTSNLSRFYPVVDVRAPRLPVQYQ